ncbi:M15 family metallopeptidase [Oscillibacter sp.]|uniref:M15 family metallopeptidase n=1 Tax=Oscillibacter sp. TaxID=1945593 RepID=UPI0028AC010E|nr:M15 family metallopeptidase [Oscillibacter sp.]
MKNARRQHKTKKNVILLAAVILLFFSYIFAANGIIPINFIFPSFSDIFPSSRQVASTDHGWNLILVNKDNYIPDNYEVELTVLSNGQSIDTRIYPSLQKMFNDMRSDGYYSIVASGYRTQEKQQELMDEKTQAYMDEGHSKSEAKNLAEEWVAVPGTSEHQLGLAVDINQDASLSTADEVYGWLAENAYKYGFIQRYPADKTEITSTIYEPWHYRYVGINAATEIYMGGICLEEYISKLNE